MLHARQFYSAWPQFPQGRFVVVYCLGDLRIVKHLPDFRRKLITIHMRGERLAWRWRQRQPERIHDSSGSE